MRLTTTYFQTIEVTLMALPNALLVGAMKSGTTGLYIDLATHPNVYLAQDKEPQCLCSDHVLTREGRQDYAELYASAHASQLILDASTSYTKRPNYDGVVSRALNVQPEGFKVIYMVRHPIDRIMSQHHHEYSDGLVSGVVNAEVCRHSRYLDYSKSEGKPVKTTFWKGVAGNLLYKNLLRRMLPLS